MSSELRTASPGIGAISPLARSIGGELARRCRSDALLPTSARRRVSIRSNAGLPRALVVDAWVTVGSEREGLVRGAAAGGAGAAACAGVGLSLGAPAARGSIRAAIFPFWVIETSKLPSAEAYSKRTLPAASSACGWFCGAISRTKVRICVLVSDCFITGRAESLMVTVAISPSVRTSAVPLLVTRRLRKRSSWAISVQWTNAIDQRTIDQARFVGCIKSQEPRLEGVEVVEHARAVGPHLQANRAEANFATDENDLEESGWNGSFARVLIRRAVIGPVGRDFCHALLGDKDHFGVRQLEGKERRVRVEQLGDILELERTVRREVNENGSLHLLTGQHGENDRFAGRFYAVHVRAVSCELHRHAREG